MNNKYLISFLTALLVITCGVSIFFSCTGRNISAKNITKKELKCAEVKADQSHLILFCCQQLMTDANGSSSRDVFCNDIQKETAEKARQLRKKDLYKFCFESVNRIDNNCWDKLHTK